MIGQFFKAGREVFNRARKTHLVRNVVLGVSLFLLAASAACVPKQPHVQADPAYTPEASGYSRVAHEQRAEANKYDFGKDAGGALLDLVKMPFEIVIGTGKALVETGEQVVNRAHVGPIVDAKTEEVIGYGLGGPRLMIVNGSKTGKLDPGSRVSRPSYRRGHPGFSGGSYDSRPVGKQEWRLEY